MPSGSYRGGPCERYDVFSAPAAFTVNVPIVVEDFHGIPAQTGAIGDRYVLQISGEFIVDHVTGVNRGEDVFITDATGVLAAAGGAGLRLFGKCTREPGDAGCPTGKMWVRLAEQDL